MRVKEAIIVEGRYDKHKLSSLVDATIIETNGFAIFNNRDKLELLRRLARERGLIILTDSDSAGFLIRGRLASHIPPEQIKNAYIPDLYGKEKRKTTRSKEGKLGVEGMQPDILYAALKRAGATIESDLAESAIENGDAPFKKSGKITKADFFELGLSGGADSADRRKKLQKRLELPEHLSSNGLLQVINALYDREDFLRLYKNDDFS